MTRSEHVADNSFPSCGSTVVIDPFQASIFPRFIHTRLAFCAADVVWVGMIGHDD